MQRIDNDGLRQEIEKFNAEKMHEWLRSDNTSSVEVFKGTPDNIEARKKAIGKPFRYKLSRGFKKAPSIKQKKK